MSDFKARMHQIQFSLGLRSRPRSGSLGLQRSSRPLSVFKGTTSKGREEGREEEGKGRGRVKDMKGVESCPPTGESGSVSASTEQIADVLSSMLYLCQ